MQLKFRHRFAGIGFFSRELHSHALVDHPSIARKQAAIYQRARGTACKRLPRRGAEHLPNAFGRLLTAHADNPDCAAGRSRNRGNRIKNHGFRPFRIA